MKPISLSIDVTMDERTNKPLAAYIKIRDGFSAETRVVEPGKAFADYDDDGDLLGIELLAPCSVSVLDRITDGQPEPYRHLSEYTPRGLVAC